MIEPWEVRRSERIYENKVFSVRADWCADPRRGGEHPFWVLESSDWVNVVPRTEAGEYILVSQWRFGTREVSLEIPGGIVDPGESPAAAAARELIEETGHVPGRIIAIGTADPNPAIQGNRLHIFAAEGCRPASDAERRATDELENIEVRLVPQAELDRLIAAEGIRSSNVLAGLLRHRLWLEAGGAAGAGAAAGGR